MKNIKKRSILKMIIGVLCVVAGLEIGIVSYIFTTSEDSFQKNLDLGNKYLLEMDYDGAIDAFSKAIEIDGMSWDAYVGRGDAYKALGDYKRAWEDYEKAEELSGDRTILDEKIGRSEIRVVSAGGGVADAAVTLLGETHHYEFVTDHDGYLRETIFPENYRVIVTKENFKKTESVLTAANGGSRAGNIDLEPDSIPFTYDAINNYLSRDYSSSISYMPDRYALIDIDKNRIPELILADDTEIDYGQVNSSYEVFCYDERQGVMKSAGKLTDTLRHYGIYYTASLPGLLTYYRTSGSHIDYVYEFDGSHMNWRYNSSWERSGVSPYRYKVTYEDESGLVSSDELDADQYIAEYNAIVPEITLELTMYAFDASGQYNLTESDVQG